MLMLGLINQQEKIGMLMLGLINQQEKILVDSVIKKHVHITETP
jgi:hypothetical protein